MTSRSRSWDRHRRSRVARWRGRVEKNCIQSNQLVRILGPHFHMSAQAEKVLRRDLRRAMGEQAIGVIDHNAKLLAQLQKDVSSVANSIHHARADHQRLEINLAKCGAMAYDIQTDTWPSPLAEELRDHGARLGNLMSAHVGFTTRTFWQRLRWLVRGR